MGALRPREQWIHTHSFSPVPGATPGGFTLLRDEVEYELPLLLLPGLPLVLHKLRRMFEYRHQVTAAEVALMFAHEASTLSP